MSASVAEQTASLLREISSEAKNVSLVVEKLTKKVEEGELNTSKGISFLEVKHELLLSYLVNLTHLMRSKVAGESIDGSPDITRLVEIRTVLEKMRPIEHKLRYQIDKLIQIAVQGGLAKDDPLSFKPNPENLISKIDESESGSESEGEMEKESKPKLYVPPRLQAMHYDGDRTVKDRADEKLSKAKKRALHSSILHELREEYSEAPEEVAETQGTSSKLRKELRARNNYEEDHFVRLGLSKKTKNDMRHQHRFQSNLDKLTNFGDISALDKSYDPTEKTSKKGTKRKAGKGKDKGKGKKHRFH